MSEEANQISLHTQNKLSQIDEDQIEEMNSESSGIRVSSEYEMPPDIDVYTDDAGI